MSRKSPKTHWGKDKHLSQHNLQIVMKFKKSNILCRHISVIFEFTSIFTHNNSLKQFYCTKTTAFRKMSI